ncbi:MAG: protein translocase subunit SecD [Acidimicrobiia bacterium]|nr:protein translocase subunit SecD [Acidimicrobiia bacterium]
MTRGQLTSLIGIVAIAVAGLVYTFVAGNEPLLGLDLQGGVSVVLQPAEDVDDDTLDEAIAIMRRRIDALGVAEPEISRQGSDILVSIPGIDDQERAIELVGQTAELRFRPVIQDMGVVPVTEEGQAALAELEAAATTTSAPAGPTTTAEASASTTAAPETTTAPETTGPATTAPAGADQGDAAPVPRPRRAPLGQTGTVPTTTGPTASTTTAAPTTPGTDAPTTTAGAVGPVSPSTTVAAEPVEPEADPAASLGSAERCLADFAPRAEAGIAIRSDGGFAPLNDAGYTSPEDDLVCDSVVLPEAADESGLAAAVLMGPTAFTGIVVDDATARLDVGAWRVDVVLRGGDQGAAPFDELAQECFGQAPTCPSGRIGIALDGVVQSSPSVNATEFGGQVQITGNFSEREAKDLALVLRFGALPVELEIQTTQQVSATIGEDSLNAGIISGIVGLLLVSLFIIGYYRLLGVVAMASLGVSFALLWTIISWLGATQGLALTLAGVTGLIVSVGVSVDSNIVYFEHLREDVRNGRTPRSAVDRAFPVAFSTIFWADIASLIGAAVLYLLTVGGVRGFAFFLGLSVVLDLVATYFFMRPAVLALTRSKSFDEHPGRFGIPPRVVEEEGSVSP